MDKADNIKISTVYRSKVSRILDLKALHKSVEFSLKRLAQGALRGLNCRSSDDADILFHTLLILYFAGKSECEAMLLARQGTKNATLFHNYVVAKGKITSNRKKSR